MALIPPSFLKSVVALGNREPNGAVTWIASGFFFGQWIGDLGEGRADFATYLVTNRHVAHRLTHPVLRANSKEPLRQVVDVNLGIAPRAWTYHPDDSIDIAVTPIGLGGLLDAELDLDFFRSNSSALNSGQMRDQGLSAGDGIFLLGFPFSLVSEPGSTAIVRGGCIASLMDGIAGHESDFLVDVASFPGNSGGPVINRPEVTAIAGTSAVSSAFLIGVNFASVPYEDLAVSHQTGRPRVSFQENSGLACILFVDRISETILSSNAADQSAPSPD